MRRRKSARILVIAAGLVVALVVAAVVIGESVIEQWCRAQIEALAADHLEGSLSFRSIDYSFPRTLILRRARLRQDGVSIIEIGSARLTLARIPRPGEPVVFERVTLDKPTVRVVEADGGGIVGFDRLIRPGPGRLLDDGGSTRLSDVLAIDRIVITGGEIAYERPGLPVMRLKPLAMEIGREQPATSDGWYAFTTALHLEPVVHLDADARLNADTGEVDIKDAVLRTHLEPGRYGAFPPAVQQVLADYEIRGDLEARAHGAVSLDKAGLQLDVVLTGASAAFGEYLLPVELLDVDAGLADGRLDVTQASIRALGGKASVTGSLSLSPADGYAFSGRASGAGIRLEQALEPGAPHESTLVGDTSFEVTGQGAIADFDSTFGGSGTWHITNGRLGLIHVFRNLLSVGGQHNDVDKADVELELASNRLHSPKFQVVGDMIAIAGSGDLYYDGRLDLVVNAGPIERLQGALGKVGDVIGSLTGKLLPYTVTGTIDAPQVDARPLGIGAGRPTAPSRER